MSLLSIGSSHQNIPLKTLAFIEARVYNSSAQGQVPRRSSSLGPIREELGSSLKSQALAIAKARASQTILGAGFLKNRPDSGRPERKPAPKEFPYEALAKAKARACKYNPQGRVLR
ncbi:hypothetical protein TVAG_293350 [Trichomonas vaginalis G3]|uniref:Uncharacterized protein n=1 Tax=Trichomonas vaginalis (strain ATCC PRA-98 / G3) TaxID=412133 RepID=A2G4P1_TRIV3|nr:hypothetical protein TVAGG3_0348530 [Trichomonas vaginalis G3]EAX87872.1 hypothetical protein TVAG_293350 [Trichomonas vaginalis G3]KAI5531118.1 hypothetical protein TVAGG3_0348530 [Trichomonas vaginalis G3]|eukprot:XP_001300802.1 hypothetical protein [Trichomonas vaginalis G3]